MQTKIIGLAVVGACFGLGAASVTLESENVMGVHRIEGKVGNQIVPVPWTVLGSPDTNPVERVTISNLISVADLTMAKDGLKSFNGEDQLFDAWIWAGEDRGWRFLPVVGQSKHLVADQAYLDRGAALWMNLSKDQDIYLIGQASTNAPVSQLASSTEAVRLSFLANPYDREIDLLGRVEGAIVGDTLTVVKGTETTLYRYAQPADGGEAVWGRDKLVQKTVPLPFGGTTTTTVTEFTPCVVGEMMLPADAGLWYECAKGDVVRSPKLKW